jgi:hypothetical protein
MITIKSETKNKPVDKSKSRVERSETVMGKQKSRLKEELNRIAD